MSRLLVVLCLALCTLAAAEDAPPAAPPPTAPAPTGDTPAPLPGEQPAAKPAKPAKPPKPPKQPKTPGMGKGVPLALVNPGFDEELTGWDHADAPEMAGAFTLDDVIKRSGKAALHVKPQSPQQWPWISQKVTGLQAGATYMLRLWHMGGNQPGVDTCAAIKLEFVDEAGKVLGARLGRQQVRMQQWLFLAAAEAAPPGTAGAVVYLRVMGGTDVWFDDVELVRLKDAPKLSLSPARMAATVDDTPKVTVTLTAAADVPENAKISLSLTGPVGKPIKDVAGELQRRDARTFAGEMTLPKLAAGQYVWEAKAGSDRAAGRIFVTPAQRQPKNLNDRGIMLSPAGQPVFPIGIYHTAVGDYKALAGAGFSAVQGLGTHERALLNTSVKEAEAQKLGVQIPLHVAGLVGANLRPSLEKVPFAQKSPAVWDWKIADEPDQHPETMDEVPESYFALKLREAERPLALTVSDPQTYGYWAHFCDSLQVVAMPLPDKPLTLVSERVKQARQALAPWQHLSVLLPAGYRAGEPVQPTLQQARMMVYLAVIAGARSVWWYALRSAGYNTSEGPLWKDFPKLNEETAALGAVALAGQDLAVQSSQPALAAAAWRDGDTVRLAVANPGAEPVTATLGVGSAVDKPEVKQGRCEASVKDGALVVTLDAGEAALVAVTAAK